MAEPSEQERETTRKRQLAAEAIFLLLLLRALQQKKNRKAALLKALLDGQIPLRRLARERLAAELGIRLRDLPLLPIELSRSARQRAVAIVNRFTGYAADRTRNTPTPDLRAQAQAAVQSRVRMIAANEAVRAFEEERRTMAEAYARATGQDGTKRWDAVSDMDVCEDCQSLDGEEIPMTDEFQYGDPPLHPNCRCSVEYLFDS